MKGSAGGRPPNFDKQRCRERNTVERAVSKLRNCRATATRYEKRGYMYRGTIAVTSIWIWLRDPSPTELPDTPSHKFVPIVRPQKSVHPIKTQPTEQDLPRPIASRIRGRKAALRAINPTVIRT